MLDNSTELKTWDGFSRKFLNSRVTEKFLGVKAWAGEDKVAQKEGNEKIVCWAVVPTFQSRHGMPRVKLRLPVKTTVWISILGYVVPNLKVFPSISPSLVLSEAQLSMVVEQKRFFSRAQTGDTYCTSDGRYLFIQKLEMANIRIKFYDNKRALISFFLLTLLL